MSERNHDVGRFCLCVSDHRPAPLELNAHHVWPLANGGPDVPENIVWLCPTAHTNVHELLRLMMKAGRPMTDAQLSALVPQAVSRYAASLARLGWRRIVSQSMDG